MELRPIGRSVDRLGPFVVALYLIVVVAAGVSGVVLLVAPGSTERYFSWTLRPRAAAAMIGGFYVASALGFAWALTTSPRQARALLVGILGLAVPTLVLTIIHNEVFDFSRWQAIAWVVLFVGAPVSALIALVVTKSGGAVPSQPLRAGARALIGVLALVLITIAVLVWFDETRSRLVRHAPFDLLRLTGTYLGAWCSFLALLCGWAALRGEWDDARGSLVLVALASAGASGALLRTIGDIRRPVLSVAVAVAVGAIAVVTYALERPASGASRVRAPGS